MRIKIHIHVHILTDNTTILLPYILLHLAYGQAYMYMTCIHIYYTCIYKGKVTACSECPYMALLGEKLTMSIIKRK